MASHLTTTLKPLAVRWMFVHWGWQTAFYLTGATGFVWVAAWWWLYDAPENHPRLIASELRHIKEGQPATSFTP